MSNRKLFVIWNPFAGGRGKRIVEKLIGSLKEHNLSYKLFDTGQSKSAQVSVKENLNSTYTDLVIVGGDGTINEALNGLEFPIPVSILPAGTGNDFIKMTAIGKTLEQQIQTVITGSLKCIDLGICNGRKFINGVGIGFDGQIVEDMISNRVPFLTGNAAYYYHILRILWGYKERPFKYHFDGVNYRKDLILLTIGNGSTFGGGFKLLPQAKIDDGLLDVCEIGRFPSLSRFLNIHKLAKGTHATLPRIHLHQTCELTLEASDSTLFAHIDGERLKNPPFHIRVLPGAVQLRVTSND